MTDEIMNVRASLLLPSNMNMAEFEEKIFGQAAAAAATPVIPLEFEIHCKFSFLNFST